MGGDTLSRFMRGVSIDCAIYIRLVIRPDAAYIQPYLSPTKYVIGPITSSYIHLLECLQT